MPKDTIQPSGMARPTSPYSPATRVGNLVFISGQVAFDAEGKVVGEGDVKRQTEQCLENFKRIVEAAGGSMRDVVKTTVFLTQQSNFAVMNDVYRRYFETEQPARSTVITGLARPELLVEIEGIANVT